MKKQKSKRLLAVLLSVLVVFELAVSVMLGAAAGEDDEQPVEIITATKQLLDFTNTEVATDIDDAGWPEGISKMDYDNYKYDSSFSVDIAEDEDGEKFLKFNFDQLNNVSTSTTISSRGGNHKIFVKATIPAWYIKYLKDISLDYVYNYNKSGAATAKNLQAFYILGVSDQTVFSKSTDAQNDVFTKDSQVQSGTVTKALTDLGKFTGSAASTFLGNTQGLNSAPKWTADDLAAQGTLDVILMFSAPRILNPDMKAGYYFGIKGINVTIEGPKEEIENIDNEDYIKSEIVTFDEGETLDEVKANLDVTFRNTERSELAVGDAYKGNNAFLFKRKAGTGSDYDSQFSIVLDNRVSRSQGITFMAKNICDRDFKFTIRIKIGDEAKATYRYAVSIPGNMTEYKRFSFYWNNVGLMNWSGAGTEWWSGTTSGNAISESELASGVSLQLYNYGNMNENDPGVLFDEFEYITANFSKERTVDLVTFDSSTAGGELPANVKIEGNYNGSTEIIENADGTKSLRLNYDTPAAADTSSEVHHLRSRKYFRVSVDIPRGALYDISEIELDVYNNIESLVTDAKQPAASLYNLCVADTVNLKYGKTPEINDTVNFIGSSVIAKKVTDMRYLGSEYSLTAWTSIKDKWTVETVKDIDKIYFYVSPPDCDGTEGMYFTINSIKLKYNEPPVYNEEKVREIVHSESVQPLTSGNITAETVVIGNVDPNSSEFSTAVKVNVKNAENTERLVLKNEYSEYYRNLAPFYEKGTATFHMFAFSQTDIKFLVSAIDKNGAELSTEIEIPAATTKLYTEASVKLNEVYDAAVAANPDFTFDMTDIRAIAILPEVDEPCTFNIAGATILTGEYSKNSDDAESQKHINLVNFDNCEVGTSQLPSNVTVSGYAGSKEIVRTADGSNALQVNFDSVYEETNTGDTHQTYKRKNIVLTVSVPKGSLDKLTRIRFTMTNNSLSANERFDKLDNVYLTMAAKSSDYVVRQGESAQLFSAEKGVTTTVLLDVQNGFAIKPSQLTYWVSKNAVQELDPERFAEFDSIVLYASVPDITAADLSKNWNFQINSIDLEFEEKPLYNEPETRLVVDGDNRVMASTGSTLKVTMTEIASNNINYRTFKKYYTLDAAKGNEAVASVINARSKFLRNIEAFVDTATFRMYYQTEKATKALVNLVNANGEKLPFELDLAASKSDKFDEITVSFKEVYDAFVADGGVFDLKDITAIEIRPLSDSAAKFNIASPTLWSKEAGSAGGAGNYYYALEDDTVRVEGYDYNIADDYSVTIEKITPQDVSANGIRMPEGSTLLSMVRISLRNGNGELVAPTGRFWVSIKLPSGIDYQNVKMYEVFFDGSLVQVKLTSMDANNYISCEDYFASKTYAVLIVPPTEEITEDEPVDDDYGPTGPTYEEVIIPSDNDGDVVETPSQETIRRLVKKKRSNQGTDYTWLWIVIAVVAAVVVIATGLVVYFIVRKKRKNMKKGAL